MDISNLIIYIIPLILGLFIISIIPNDDKQSIKAFSLLLSSLMVILTIDLWYLFDVSIENYQYCFEFLAIPSYEIYFSLGIDGITVGFLLLTVIIMHLCFLAADTNIKQYKQLVLNMLLIQLFLTLTFMTTDLFFFIFFLKAF